jgi:hypothetical protein
MSHKAPDLKRIMQAAVRNLNKAPMMLKSNFFIQKILIVIV